MQVADAQREVRTVFVGGFWGQLFASAIWLASAALGTWGTPRSAILELIVCGFFIFPATQLLLHLERFQDRCALSIFNARSPLHGVGSTWVHALGYSNPETAIVGGPASLSKGNPLGKLGMQIAFTLPMTMLLLAPVGAFRLNWFFPAFMILLGAHYLPFTFLYGMRLFIPLCALLVGGGVVIAEYFSGSFSTGAWVTGVTLFVFAWIGRASV